MKKIFILAAIFASLPAGADIGRHFDSHSGLSENTIKAILQDADGHMWFATQDGLNVYNGKTFKSYGCSYIRGRDTSVTSINLYDILLHEDGRRIWAASYDGVFLFDPGTESFSSVEQIRGKVAGCLEYGRNGELWIGDNWGTTRYDPETGGSKEYRSARTDAILCDSNGHIWAGSMDGIARLDPVRDIFSPVEISGTNGRNHVITLAEDSDGRIWAGTWYNGFALYDIRSDKFRIITPKSEIQLPSVFRVRHITEEKNGVLLLCSNIGLFRYEVASNRLSFVPLSDNLFTESTYTICVDRERGIWIGTYYNGFYYISPKLRGIDRHLMENVNSRGATAFCENEDGKIWVGSENGGVSVFNPFNGRLEEVPFNIPGENVHTIFRYDNTLYLGTFSNGLRAIDLRSGKSKAYHEGRGSIPDDHIFFSGQLSDGRVAIGTLKGACFFDPERLTFTSQTKLPSDAFIVSICEDGHGFIWYADFYNGLYRENVSTGEFIHYSHSEVPGSLPENKLLSIHYDSQGRLWICSNGNGIFEYRYETDEFKPFEITVDGEDVKLSIICGAVTSADGKLWLSSFNGLYCCDISNGTARRITNKDGLQSNQFNFGSAFRSSTGDLYFGGINGFNVLSPDIFQKYSSIPSVTVSAYYDGFRVPQTSRDFKLKIPRSINSLSLEFECLSFASNEPPAFLYSIDSGEEQRTIESVLSFANFPYGRHKVVIRAVSGDKTESGNSVTVSIINLRPVPVSIAAVMLYIVAAILLSVFVFLETKKIRSRKEKDRVIDLLVHFHNKNKLIKKLDAPKPEEKDWTERLSAIIQNHISESDLSVEELAEAMNMGRSAFQRKVKEESGLTPIEFVRLIRLKNAAALLSEGQHSISQVCFMVGFNKPSYFSSCFRHQFGMLPKDYAKRARQK